MPLPGPSLPFAPLRRPRATAGGCCFDFNREQDCLFVVGAEDGSLYKCSTAYASEYLQVAGLGGGRGRGTKLPELTTLSASASSRHKTAAVVSGVCRWMCADPSPPCASLLWYRRRTAPATACRCTRCGGTACTRAPSFLPGPTGGSSSGTRCFPRCGLVGWRRAQPCKSTACLPAWDC